MSRAGLQIADILSVCLSVCHRKVTLWYWMHYTRRIIFFEHTKVVLIHRSEKKERFCETLQMKSQIQIAVLRDMTPCSLAEMYRRFADTYCYIFRLVYRRTEGKNFRNVTSEKTAPSTAFVVTIWGHTILWRVALSAAHICVSVCLSGRPCQLLTMS